MFTGATIGRFLIEDRLGSGSFASVWRATDPELQSQVAIKILADNWNDSSDVRDRFLREARILRSLDFSGIVQVYDIGTLDDGRPYFAMEYADRGSLQDRLDERTRNGQQFSVQETIAISADIARALEVAHNAGIIHRDLKPSNILFRSTSTPFGSIGELASRDSQPERLILADFGIARQLATGSGYTIAAGTPNYMAPEQASPETSGTVDQRSDIYSAAALAFELLTGSVPAPANSLTAVAKRQRAVRPGAIREVRPDVPRALEAVILSGLEDDPNDRPASASTWASALRDTAQDDSATMVDDDSGDDTATDGPGAQETVTDEGGWPPTQGGDGQPPARSSRNGCLVAGVGGAAIVLLLSCVAAIAFAAFSDEGEGSELTPEPSPTRDISQAPSPTSDPSPDPTRTPELNQTPEPAPTTVPTPIPEPTPEPTPVPENPDESANAPPPIQQPLENLVVPAIGGGFWLDSFFWTERQGVFVGQVDQLSPEVQMFIEPFAPENFQYLISDYQYQDVLIHAELELHSGAGWVHLGCRTDVPLNEDFYASGYFLEHNYANGEFQFVGFNRDVAFIDEVFVAPAASNPMDVHLLCDGDRIAVWVNGAKFIDIEDDTISSGRISTGTFSEQALGLNVLYRNVWVQARE